MNYIRNRLPFLIIIGLFACSPFIKKNIPEEQERIERFDDLKGFVQFSLQSDAKDIKFKGALILSKDLLYLEGLNPLGQPLQYLLVNPLSIFIYSPGEKTVYIGDTDRENIYQLFNLSVDFSELVGILTANLSLTGSWQAEKEGRFYHLSRLDSKGEKELEVFYRDYQKKEKFIFPRVMEIVFLRNKTKIKIVFKNVAFNTVGEKINEIKLPLPEGTTVRALGDLN